ncbi:hypothetical protein CRE_22243 [Caenorhabditis remanei]|uniref:F-box domain-containing protein n=1 Tax=Caenorhabditis remanei TaxID=31234 RepID=E3NSS5_CAERE|nr:hypothetical protein CRE_22243 [Caenorhabditis remanei]
MTEFSKALPLFRLPLIPLIKISRYMHLREILLISLASKKSAYIIRCLLPPNWFFLQMSFSEESKIFLGAKGPWAPVIIKGQKTGDVYELQIAQHNGVVSHRWTSPDLEDIVKPMLIHFALTFNPTISIKFGHICHQDFAVSVLEHVKQLNLMITSLKILSDANISPENYEHILDRCKNIPELVLSSEVTSDFQYRVGPDFSVDDFLVRDGHWMHLEDFSNCKKVTVWNSSGHTQQTYANSKVPRALIKKWIDSDCRLEHLEVSGYRFFSKEVTSVVENGFVSMNLLKLSYVFFRTTKHIEGYLYPVIFNFNLILQGLEFRQTANSHSVEITRRCDGKKATVKCRPLRFELKVID